MTASVRPHIFAAFRRRRTMALSRTTRVNLLIGNGHFLSHFYLLCLPPLFLAWQSAFDVTFAELGLTVALMSGTPRCCRRRSASWSIVMAHARS